MPVAIHCEPVNEPHRPYASLKTRWIAASLPLVAPRNDTGVEYEKFPQNPSRNDSAMDGRMTDKATKKGGARRVLARGGAGPNESSGACVVD